MFCVFFLNLQKIMQNRLTNFYELLIFCLPLKNGYGYRFTGFADFIKVNKGLVQDCRFARAVFLRQVAGGAASVGV
jgi:hypothetical protein